MKAPKNLQIGISSYAYTWAIGVPGHEPKKAMTAHELLDKAVSLRIKHVQIADNMPLENFCDVALRALKTYADTNTIKLEVGAKKLTRQRLRRYLEIAKMLGSDIIRFIIDGDEYEPTIDEIVSEIVSLLPELEASRIYLAIENHDRLLTTEFLEILKKVHSPWVGICLDTVNSMGAGEGLETVIHRLGPHTVNFHVKEFIIKRIYHMMGFEIEGVPLGEGQLPVRQVLKNLSPNCRTAILEQWTPPVPNDIQATVEKEDAWATQSIAYLKTILEIDIDTDIETEK